jgi:hypothetical protein
MKKGVMIKTRGSSRWELLLLHLVPVLRLHFRNMDS